MSVSVGVAAKKVLEVIASNKKGRKFLGYVIGITLFILFLPVIILVGFFGWMSGGEEITLDSNSIMQNFSPAYQEEFQKIDAVLDLITVTFYAKGLPDKDISIAKTIYISCLVGKEDDENFYTNYADCFINTDEVPLLINISFTFDVTFTREDEEYFEKLYGGAE